MKCSCNFSIVTTNLQHGIFLSSLMKLTRKQLVNTVLDYQHKFGNSLHSINAESLEQKTKFNKMEADLAISRNVNVKLVERLVVTERKCWANKQYSRRECLKISGIPESVSDDLFEDKIIGVLREIDVEVNTKSIESCYCQKGKKYKGKLILRLSTRKDADKIKLNKNNLKNIDHKKTRLATGTKVFINEIQQGYYMLLWSKCKKIFLEKKIA